MLANRRLASAICPSSTDSTKTFSAAQKCDSCTARDLYVHHDYYDTTMASHDIESKKRKRKHKGKKSEVVDAIPAASNGAAGELKPRKKAKKEHTPEPEVKDVTDVVSGGEEDGEDEAALNEELKDVAAQTKVAKVAADEELDEQNDDRAPNDLPSGTTVSLPTVEDPTKFSELNLSERTSKAIEEIFV